MVLINLLQFLLAPLTPTFWHVPGINGGIAVDMHLCLLMRCAAHAGNDFEIGLASMVCLTVFSQYTRDFEIRGAFSHSTGLLKELAIARPLPQRTMLASYCTAATRDRFSR